MASELLVAVYDACVLYPFHLRNLLVQCAVDRLVEARWTNEIHEEWIRNPLYEQPRDSDQPSPCRERLDERRRAERNRDGLRAIIPSIVLPDANDRHVVAAAVAASASMIVTWNVRDFPTAELHKNGLQKQTPDLFLTRLYDRIPDLTIEAVAGA